MSNERDPRQVGAEESRATPPRSRPTAPVYETPADRAIREAMERGEFDDLPGSGKPLPPLGDPNDPLWWVRGLADREQLDFTGALPPAIALRKEAAGFPESLLDLRSEESVRTVLEDFNTRVRRDRLRLPEPGLPQVLAPTVDVEALVAKWRDLKAAEASRPEAEESETTQPGHTPSAGASRRRWWRPWRSRRP
ncbi:MAG: DUF1992 domain-containing protein [Actinomycetales bacterium]|nr:DUF1992 domain-containing protein [Actinomycetales bacterium]